LNVQSATKNCGPNTREFHHAPQRIHRYHPNTFLLCCCEHYSTDIAECQDISEYSFLFFGALTGLITGAWWGGYPPGVPIRAGSTVAARTMGRGIVFKAHFDSLSLYNKAHFIMQNKVLRNI
ncbi:MAG: hypothetical protein IJ382_03240, partial [Flavobacteriales bacterium]|nr:hypothetical protein [Flavobacteriales bacterium]